LVPGRRLRPEPLGGHAGHRPGDEGNSRTTRRGCQRRADWDGAFAWPPEAAEARPGDGFFVRHLFSPLAKAALRRHYADLALMEDTLRDSGLGWTVVQPPKLTDKPMTGAYRIAY
jgi:hypothetical protein